MAQEERRCSSGRCSRSCSWGSPTTVFHVLADQLLFAAVNGTACVVALSCMYLIFLRS